MGTRLGRMKPAMRKSDIYPQKVCVCQKNKMAHNSDDFSLLEEHCESMESGPLPVEAAQATEMDDVIAEYFCDKESLKVLGKPESVSNVEKVTTCPTLPACSENWLEDKARSPASPAGGFCTNLKTSLHDFDQHKIDHVTSPRTENTRKNTDCSDLRDHNNSDPKESQITPQASRPNMVVSERFELYRTENIDETEFRHRHSGITKGNVVETAERPYDNVQIPAGSKRKEEQQQNAAPIQPDLHDEHKEINKTTKLSLFRYFMTEISRGYLMELDEDRYTDKRRKVYKIMKIPKEFEKLMVFGFMLCLDCFLFIFTYLPLRVTVALFNLLGRLFCFPGTRLLEPAQICDLMKGAIIVLCSILLTYVDFSVMYHTVRGQSVIKLYVIYNMLEIADRLFSSFGQDILDSLFWTATEPKDRGREHIGILPHFVLAVIYVFLHAVLVLFQATCLNVAVNSHSKALLVIMVSNQFIELKGSVFKRFERNNLFQMACSDIRERFHYMILVTICALRNLTEFNWNLEHLYVILPYLMAVLVSEYFVDWIKHAFITKFNDIPAEVYTEYRAHLAQDATSSRQKNAQSDHFDLVSRRLGFIPLPLGSVVIRVVSQSIKLHGLPGICLVIVTYLFLMSAKVLNSIILLGKAFKYASEKQQKTADEARKSVMTKMNAQASVNLTDFDLPSKGSLDSSRDKHSVEKPQPDTKRQAKTLAEIDRYTLCSKEIVLF